MTRPPRLGGNVSLSRSSSGRRQKPRSASRPASPALQEDGRSSGGDGSVRDAQGSTRLPSPVSTRRASRSSAEWAQFQFEAWPEDLDCEGALRETAGALAGDLVTLRAVLLAPPVLLSIPEHVLVEVKTVYARTLDPEGFERRELLDKALAMIERSNRKFMGEIHDLLPPQLVSAPSNDKGAAARAEKLAEAEFQRTQTESQVLGAEPHSIPPLSERMAAAAAEMGA